MPVCETSMRTAGRPLYGRHRGDKKNQANESWANPSKADGGGFRFDKNGSLPSAYRDRQPIFAEGTCGGPARSKGDAAAP
jgi:hypothetical protein